MSNHETRTQKHTDSDVELLDACHLPISGTIAVYGDAAAGEWIETELADCIDGQCWA